MLPAIIALGGLALSAGKAFMEHKAQNQAAKANTVAANSNYRSTIDDLRARLSEEKRSTGLTIQQAIGQVRSTKGSAVASAAASGVSGISIDALLRDVSAQGAAYKVSAEDNLDATGRQIGRLEQQAAVQRDNQIAGIQTANPLLTGLKIGAGALDAATAYRGMTRA